MTEKTEIEDQRLHNRWLSNHEIHPALRALPYALFVLHCYLQFNLTVDDPFITFRYAANVLHGHGAVFNIGERVEGFTSPLHLLLCMALLSILPAVGALLKAKLASVLFGLLVLRQTGRLARELGLRPKECILAQILFALSVNVAITSVNGLETTLFAWLLLLTLRKMIHETRSSLGISSVAWALLALLTRPEMIIIAPALLAARWVILRRLRQPTWVIGKWLGCFAAGVLVITAVRYAYYGLPLPNTFYAKSILPSLGLVRGTKYLAYPAFQTDYAPMLWSKGIRFSLVAELWTLALFGAWSLKRRYAGIYCFAVVIACALFILKSGGDWMSGWRFMFAAIPALSVLQVFGIRHLIHKASGSIQGRRDTRQTAWGIVAAITCLLTIGCITAPRALPYFTAEGMSDGALISEYDRQGKGLGQLWVDSEELIRKRYLPGDVIAFSEIGYAGFRNPEIRFLDTRGLVSREVAAMPNWQKRPAGVVNDTWYHDGDLLGALLKRVSPKAILYFEGPPIEPNVVLGTYRLSHVLVSGNLSLTVFERPDP